MTGDQCKPCLSKLREIKSRYPFSPFFYFYSKFHDIDYIYTNEGLARSVIFSELNPSQIDTEHYHMPYYETCR